MNIEVIHEESVKKYMGLLTADEILGLEEDRFSCIGAYDEESGEDEDDEDDNEDED